MMPRWFAPAFLLLLAAAAPAAAQDPTEILLRLDRLESDNRRLTGDVEKMQFQIQRLEQQLKKAQADNELRFQDLEGGAAAPKPRPPKQPAADAGDEPLPDAPPVDPPVEKPRTAGSGAKADYDSATALLDSENFADAEVAFRDFLKKYPKDKLAADATFGLGESLFARERYADAAEHYLNLTNQFPNARRAPEALLKLGMSLNALGARVEACSTYDEVAKKYPKADADVRQAVQRQRERAKCE